CTVNHYFFFQAEDGIRDRNVTGVQTCALPILVFLDSSSPPSNFTLHFPQAPFPPQGASIATFVFLATSRRLSPKAAKTVTSSLRSEERRVGKECRCGCGV